MKKTISLLLSIALLLTTVALASNSWTCPSCGMNGLTGNFCPNCGTAKSSSAARSSVNVYAGANVFFGNYEQDGNYYNGPEPIEWTVLSVNGSKAYLVSKDVLKWDFFSTLDSVTFNQSTINAWLNNNFYYSAFSSGEQNAVYGSVTLLSEAEVRQYMGTFTSRIARPTSACANEGAYVWPGIGACDWWLRDTFEVNDYASAKVLKYTKLITGSGDYDLNGQRQNVNRRGVRPAIWVDVSML